MPLVFQIIRPLYTIMCVLIHSIRNVPLGTCPFPHKPKYVHTHTTNCFYAIGSSPVTLVIPRSVPQWPLLPRQLQQDPASGVRLRRADVRQLVPNGAGGVPPRASTDQPQGQSRSL